VILNVTDMRKFILKQLFNRISPATSSKYFFVRWLIDLFQTDSDRIAAQFFVYDIDKNDSSLSSLIRNNVSDILVFEKTAFFVTHQAGLIIGNGGENIDKIKQYTEFEDIMFLHDKRFIGYIYSGATRIYNYVPKIEK
jgi:hypothetical protein